MDMSVGQFIAIVAAFIAGLVAFIKGLEYLFGKVSEIASRWLLSALKPMNDTIDTKFQNLEAKLDSLEKKSDQQELNRCQDFVVDVLGEAKRHDLDEIVKMRLHEDYERYTALGGNSYVHAEFEKLKEAGKI